MKSTKLKPTQLIATATLTILMLSSLNVSAKACDNSERSQVQAEIDLYRFAKAHAAGEESSYIGDNLKSAISNFSDMTTDEKIQQVEASIVKADIFEECSTELTKDQQEALEMKEKTILKRKNPLNTEE